MNQCTCPICDHESTYVQVYQHLQTGHRKSTLSRTLLEEREGKQTPTDDDRGMVERPPEESTETPGNRDPAIPQ
jgi:hypothetical protein